MPDASNTQARVMALWACSLVVALGLLVLASMPGEVLRSPSAYRNPLLVVLALMVFTGAMHAAKRAFRVPALLVSVLSLLTLCLLLGRRVAGP